MSGLLKSGIFGQFERNSFDKQQRFIALKAKYSIHFKTCYHWRQEVDCVQYNYDACLMNHHHKPNKIYYLIWWGWKGLVYVPLLSYL